MTPLEGFVGSPLGAVTLTLALYAAASALYERVRWALLHPLLLTIGGLIALLTLLGVPYAHYEAGSRMIAFFLGPAVVALAVPLAEQWGTIRREARAIGAAVGLGAVAGAFGAAGTAALLGASPEVVLSVAPRAATTPIAIGVAEATGGEPPLTAAFVIASGIAGAVVGPALLRVCRVRRAVARGLALGAAAHGIGTARALEQGPEEGAASGLALGLCGLATALVVPPVVALLRAVGLL